MKEEKRYNNDAQQAVVDHDAHQLFHIFCPFEMAGTMGYFK